jgi:carboxyl-terminal processing protease
MGRQHFFAAVVFGLSAAVAGAAPPDQDPAAVARRAWALTEIVLDKHLDPCTRQEMLLGAAAALVEAGGAEPSPDLSRRVSAITTEEQFVALLREAWPKGEAAKAGPIDDALLRGLLARVPGKPYLLPPQNVKVEEQIQGNRYVGIGIQLRIRAEEKLPQVVTPLRNGPAFRAGMKADDLVLEVDGKDAHGVPLSKVVDWLRGEDGTSVTLVVRQPKATESRTLKMTRGVVPFDTVVGYRRSGPDGWTFRIDPERPVGYVQVEAVNSATVHGLRQAEARLRAEGVRAVVLDLRAAGDNGTLQHAELVADALLDGGVMWKLRRRDGVKECRADRECLFRGWPLAVLVGETTAGLAPQAVAAALQDTGRAALVGQQAQSGGPEVPALVERPGRESSSLDVTSPIPLPDDQGAVVLRTGQVERVGKGRGWPVRPDQVVALKPRQREAVWEWFRRKGLPELPPGTDDQPPDDPQLARAVELLQAALEKAEQPGRTDTERR